MGHPPDAEITTLLSAAGRGDAQAAEDLLPLVYEHLRRVARSIMAGESPGQTLQPTALVHEAYLRVAGNGDWKHRGHFFTAVALAMRRILVEQARQKATLRRGGDQKRIDRDPATIAAPMPSLDLLALEEAVKRLEAEDPRKGQIVNLRYFVGLTVNETAAAMNVSVGTVERDWRFIKSWISAELSDGGVDVPDSLR
ncbi:MAG: sigma-70 family RNA polymerase sigma factor [Phycisphaerae bacterium]